MSTNDSGGIFIVGAPRSGTSLLRVMLNRHHTDLAAEEAWIDRYSPTPSVEAGRSG